MADRSDRDAHDLLGASVRLPEHVVHRGFAAETVVLDLSTGHYHGLNPTAGRMLETLSSVGSVDGAAARIAEEFDQPLETVRRDLCVLCADLLERGIIELDDRAA